MTDIHILPGENVTNVIELMNWTSETSGGILFPGLIFITGTIIFLATKAFSAQIAFATSVFIVSLLSIIATFLGWMNPTYMYLTFVLVGISLLMLRLSKR